MRVGSFKWWGYLVVLVAVSAAGASIRVGPWGITFDAVGGFVAALLLGPGPGALVAGLGHLAGAVVQWLPYGPFLQVPMALTAAGVGAVGALVARRRGPVMGAIALVLGRLLLLVALAAILPSPLGIRLFKAIALPVTATIIANGLVALAITLGLKRLGWKP